MKSLEQVLVETVLLSRDVIEPSNQIVGIYPYGSVLYGPIHNNSDYDFVVIIESNNTVYEHYTTDDYDIHILSVDMYQKKLLEHDIMALEVYFNHKPIIKFETDFKLDLGILRNKISAVVSNSWVKAKKKVQLEDEDTFIGYKSLFHSIRILDFGIQIAETGKINDFESCKSVWNNILFMIHNGIDFEEVIQYYKPIQNANATKFRLLTPKDLK